MNLLSLTFATTFDGVLEAGGPSFMPTQVIAVPAEAITQLGGRSAKRVMGTLNGHAVRLCLLPQPGGGRHLIINKDLCQRFGLFLGQRVGLRLRPDPAPDHVALPAELAEAFEAWPEAATQFDQLPGNMRRAVARHVAQAQRTETRARRAVIMAERLARAVHPFRKG